MAFRFSWVLAFLVIQIFFWIIWQLKDRKRDSIFPNASKKVRTVSRLNLDKGRIQWRNRLILIGLALLALVVDGLEDVSAHAQSHQHPIGNIANRLFKIQTAVVAVFRLVGINQGGDPATQVRLQ